MNVYLGANEIDPQTLGSLDLEGIYRGGDEVWSHNLLLDYLCFTANTAGSTIKLKQNGSPTSVTLEISNDLTTWSTYTIGDTITLTNVGDKVYWRNTSSTDTRFSTSSSNYYQFVMTGSIAGSGDINSLLNKKLTTTLSNCCYYQIFKGCTSLTSSPVLSATTLAEECYYEMFRGCTSLTTPPVLNSTSLAYGCYYGMFYECTSLTSSPALPATTLVSRCYEFMFYRCRSLTTPPVLSATTLAVNCYRYMFCECTNLRTAPTLPATRMEQSCYESMFSQSGITAAPALPATEMRYCCYQGMFMYCTSLTTPPKLPATTLAVNCYWGMFQLCENLTALPKLPATTLAKSCYASMFQFCSKIKISSSQTGGYTNSFRIPTTGTGTDATDSMADMFTYTGGTFTGTPTINTTYYTSNTIVS